MAHQAPQTNPLSLIGRGRPKPVDNDALRKLQTSGVIQQLVNKGGLDRQALANIGARNTAGVPLGLNFDDPDINRKLEERRIGSEAESGGRTAADLVKAGIRTDVGDFSFAPGQIKNLPFKGGQALPGEAQSLALPRVEAQAEQGAKTSITDIVGPRGERVGITAKRTREGTTKVTGKQKQTPLAKEISTDLLNAAKAQFPGMEIGEDNFDILRDGSIVLFLPGQKPIIVGKQ